MCPACPGGLYRPVLGVWQGARVRGVSGQGPAWQLQGRQEQAGADRAGASRTCAATPFALQGHPSRDTPGEHTAAGQALITSTSPSRHRHLGRRKGHPRGESTPQERPGAHRAAQTLLIREGGEAKILPRPVELRSHRTEDGAVKHPSALFPRVPRAGPPHNSPQNTTCEASCRLENVYDPPDL